MTDPTSVDGLKPLKAQEESREDNSTTGSRRMSSQHQQNTSKDDITTKEGKQQASMGESPLSLYIREMGEMQVSAMERLFDTAVDSPCASKTQSAPPKIDRTDSHASSTASDRFLRKSKAAVAASAADDVCSPMSGCQQTIEHQLDVITHCRQPLEFFPFLNNVAHHSREEGNATARTTVPLGMYTVPVVCEYCGEQSTKNCGPKCQRPKLYFRKKKPPFASSKNWDPVTEYELLPPKPPLQTAHQTSDRRESPSWVAGFFGSPRDSEANSTEIEISL